MDAKWDQSTKGWWSSVGSTHLTHTKQWVDLVDKGMSELGMNDRERAHLRSEPSELINRLIVWTFSPLKHREDNNKNCKYEHLKYYALNRE